MSTNTNNTISLTDADGNEHHVRVFGNASDPHFCSKDICQIMELENHKKAIFDNVKNNHKTELKILFEEPNNGLIEPNGLVTFKYPNSLGSVDLQNLSYHDGRLVVLSEPGVYDLLNGSRKDKNKKVLKNSIQRFVYATKYENNGGLVDILAFISKMDLAIDIKSNWFQDLWYPLTRSQPPLQGGLTEVNNRPFILTQSLLEWMGYKGRGISDKQDKFCRFLESLKIKGHVGNLNLIF